MHGYYSLEEYGLENSILKKKRLLVISCCMLLGLSACSPDREKERGETAKPLPVAEDDRSEEPTEESTEELTEEPKEAPTEEVAGEEPQEDEAQVLSETAQEKENPVIVNDGGDTFYDAMDAFYGEYAYKNSSDGLDGTLSIIQELDNSREYSIYDNNTNGYRFIAMGSNVEYIKGDRMYMKYPENVYSDGTAVF